MGFEAILEYIFIASYYRLLSNGIKMKNYKIKTSLGQSRDLDLEHK